MFSGNWRKTIRTLSPYFALTWSRVGITREQNGHWKSENSTIVTGAVAGPLAGPVAATSARSGSSFVLDLVLGREALEELLARLDLPLLLQVLLDLRHDLLLGLRDLRLVLLVEGVDVGVGDLGRLDVGEELLLGHASRRGLGLEQAVLDRSARAAPSRSLCLLLLVLLLELAELVGGLLLTSASVIGLPLTMASTWALPALPAWPWPGRRRPAARRPGQGQGQQAGRACGPN